MTRRTASRGFTLIELMIVVAIVGVLSSVAIPELNRAHLRARAAERRSIMTSIAQTTSDVMLNQARLSGGTLLGDWNPNVVVSPAKHAFNSGQSGWNQLPLAIEGATYYQYKFLVDDTVAPTTLDIWAVGDLDGDGVPSTKQISYVGYGNAFAIRIEVPEQEAEDAATF
jgi:prepilin-type N-terminal cleavage/methylation domain-containing protein